MDTIALDPRIRHASSFLSRNPLMLINGRQVPAASGKTFAVYNPATGGVIANVPEGDKADVDLAVRAARRAFDERRWGKVSPSERGRILWRIAELIERNLDELAELESIDNGKPYAVARLAGSVRSRASWVPDWWPARPWIDFGQVERGPGAWHGLRRLRLRRHLGAAGPHGAGLPAFSLPCLWAGVQRAQRRPAEPDPVSL
jgi:Aldehyde dehydrogenase family